MAVPALIRRAYKNTTTFPATDTSAAFDLGSGAGRAVLVVCGGDSGTAAGYTFTGVTVTGTGGGSLTAGTEDTSTGRTRRAFWMVDPPSGSQTFTVSTANGPRNFVYTIYLFQDPAVSGASITVTPTAFAISEVTGGANTYTVNSTTVNGLAVAIATCYTNVTSDASATNATTYTRDTSIYGAAELFAKTGSAGSTTFTWQTAGSTTLPYSTFGFALEGSSTAGGSPPTIGTQPTNQTANEGATATFSLAATGTGTLSYQWKRAAPGSGTFANVGTNSNSYTTGALSPATDHGATFKCDVTDSNGTTTSNTVTLTVLSVATTSRPAADITVAGWSASTGTDLFAMIDETTPSDTDYVISPTLSGSTAPVTFALAYPLATGTWTLGVRAKTDTGTATMRVYLLNDANTVVGTSANQAINSSFTTYSLPITTSGPATRARIEIVTP